MRSPIFPVLIAFAICTAIITGTSSASIIDTDVQIGHKYDSRFDYLTTITVVDGGDDLVDVYLGQNGEGKAGYTVNLDSSKIDVKFYFPRNFSWFNGAGTMNGLYLSGSTLDAEMFKSTATIVTNTFGFSTGRIIVLDGQTIGLDFQNLTISNRPEFSINFEQPVGVDEPKGLLVFALGCMVLLLIRKTIPNRFPPHLRFT